jgi:hypothetical protein
MAKTQLFNKFRHHKILKMATVISNDSLRNTKSSNDVIEYEQCCSSPSVIKCRHRLNPFSEVMYSCPPTE